MVINNHVNAVSDPPFKLDYSLTGVNATLAVEKGLAEADWYQCPVPRETMRKLLERRDGPAIRDTILWFALILGSGYATFALWGTWWAVLPYALYAVLYASTSDSRWHECRPRHRLQDRLDEQCRSTRSHRSWSCASPRSGAGATPATTAIRSLWAGIPRSPCPARPNIKDHHSQLLQPAGLPEIFQAHPAALLGPDGRRRKDLHPGDRIPQGLFQRPDLCGASTPR